MLRFIVGLGLLMVVIVTAVSADEPNPKNPDSGKPPKDKSAEKAKLSGEKLVDAILRRLDKDQDGKISKKEAEGPIAENFDRADKNKDGYLDREELMAVAQRLAAAAEKGKGKFLEKFKDRSRTDRTTMPDFDSLDKNADGRLTKNEVKGSVLERLFDEIDSNKNGEIDPKEYKTYCERQESNRSDKIKDRPAGKKAG